MREFIRCFLDDIGLEIRVIRPRCAGDILLGTRPCSKAQNVSRGFGEDSARREHIRTRLNRQGRAPRGQAARSADPTGRGRDPGGSRGQSAARRGMDMEAE
jgi:hypothetical protein